MLLDPRIEDPTHYLKLDLFGTFHFGEVHPAGTREHQRAKLTIDWLGLNKRESLVNHRRTAYRGFLNALRHYVEKGDVEQKEQILRLSHVTVFREMQRHHAKIPALKVLFEQAPEALAWTHA